MKVVILEDEKPAADKLTRYLHKYDPGIEVLSCLSEVSTAVKWFLNADIQPDLIFADIQLTDGLCFEIFIRLKTKVPIVFTTAYDEYAIDAFKLNSIDYLLKPISFTDLSKAIQKVSEMRDQLSLNRDFSALASQVNQRKYKDRFLVKIHNRIQPVVSKDILLFYAEGRTVYLVTNDERRYIVDFRLMQLAELVNPTHFFRVNRSYILNYSAISDVVIYSNSRLAIVLKSFSKEKIIVSRENVSRFKKWLGDGS